MAKKGKDTVHPLFYKLLKLGLVIPVATVTMEWVFSIYENHEEPVK